MATSDFEPVEPTDIPRDMGVDDIDDGELQTLISRVRHVVQRDLNATVTEIYVMGSFARGEAREVFSDLDLRVVVVGWQPEPKRQDVEQVLKCDEGPDVTPSVCGYLDVHITALHPRDEPSECIYRKD